MIRPALTKRLERNDRRTPLRASEVWRAGVARAGIVFGLALTLVAPARGEEPLWGEIASTLGKGFLNVTTRGALCSFKPYRHHGGPVSLTLDRTDVVFGAEYGLLPDLDLHVRLPLFSERIAERFSGQTVDHDLQGLGEMQIGAKWRFFQHITDRRKDELALMTDLKLPTGNSELRDRNGSLVTPHLQPNSGNLGGMLGLAANRHTAWGGYWFSTMLSAETASPRVQRGRALEMHLSTGRRFRPLIGSDQVDWMGIVGVHLHAMGKEQENGRRAEDSGGSIVSAELGVVGSRRNQGVRLGVLLPLRTDLGMAHAPPRHEIQASLRMSF